ncbi:MAG TPA: YHYH protein [Gemmataceae bacterium]|nr:YHYH protein [Gemmataceae bacterium]
MMRFLLIALCFAALQATHSEIFAHPGHDHSDEHAPAVRLWKGADGLFEVEGSFVLARDHRVLIHKNDGGQVWLPLEMLAREDQEWIRNRVGEIDSLNRIGRPIDRRMANPDPAFVMIAVGITLVVIAAMAVRSRRTRFAMPAAIMVVAPLCMLAACSAREESVIKDEQATDQGDPPTIVAHFKAFKDKLKFRWTENHLFIESNGLPDHPMMIGITNWQQQVPLPQAYAGKNAWQIPLKPKLADKPISTKNALFRGAIALAVNGVPIFNALNNRGEDAFMIGELDEYGGHCGKGDDYHYHVAPLHLEKMVGKGNPIAYALDGYALYGLTDEKLDEFNGRFDDKGNYRYHSTKKYPYINGGMRGVVEVRGDQVDPQPHAGPIRPEGRPLKGAKITDFTVDADKKMFSLKYEVKGETRKINYKVNANNSFTFTYIDAAGNEKTETYERKEGKGKKDDKKGDEKKKKKKGPGKED